MLVAPAAGAEAHVIGQSALDRAVQRRVSQERSDRKTILALLQRPEVRAIAAKAGISLDKSAAAVATLQANELQEAAQQARQVENDLAGGSRIVIAKTLIIIGVVLVIVMRVVGLNLPET